MSLLMEALQRAAQNREDAAPPASPAPLRSGGGKPRGAAPLGWAREHPLALFAGAAALFLGGWGIYIYREMNPPAPTALAVVAPAAAPSPPAGAAARGSAAASANAAPTEASRRAAVPDSPEPAAAAPLPAAEKPAEAKRGNRPPHRSGRIVVQRTRRSAAPIPAEPLPAEPLSAGAELPAQRSSPAAARVPPAPSVSVRRAPAPTIDPRVADAYDNFSHGRAELAERQYRDVLDADPKNVDALVGLAQIARGRGDDGEARRRYRQILDLDPQNAVAQAGVIGLAGGLDRTAAESRLKLLIAREPSGFLHFTLGNLYAEQNQWAKAQAAYFDAHRLEPGNADYAYNLAVGLEHLSQRRLALDFYRKALELARERGAGFDPAAAQARVLRLSLE